MTKAGIVQAALPLKDKTIIGLLLFFTAVALTLELYWLIFHQVMESRDDVFARLLSLYWPSDYSYRVPGYAPEKAFVLSVEGVNVFFTPFVSIALIWAILKRSSYRYALQLFNATYVFYGTFLYYCVAHVSGYALFESKTTYAYLMLYLANLPWLAGYAWLALDAFRAIVRRAQG
jgi:hypothetical protein